MSGYIGKEGERISFEAVYIHLSDYRTYNFSYYGEWHNVYKFKDADGNIIIWDTTSGFVEDKKVKESNGNPVHIYKGAKLAIKATVKKHSEYNGTKQTKISRPTFKLIENGKNPAEVQKEREERIKREKEEQLKSIKEGDIIQEMPYRQYKEHYSDCETIIDSYNERKDHKGNRIGIPTICVIIRAGRLKNSGTRGRHFNWYTFESGEHKMCFKAITEENARKQLRKQVLDADKWMIVK